MSLPISPMEYTTSKVLGNLSAFLVLWIAIAGMVLGTIAWSDAPDGFIPFGVIVAFMPAVVFCVLLCVAIVSESEFWTMVMTAGSNVIYSFWWFLFNRVPGLRNDLGSPVPVWSDAILTIIGVQVQQTVEDGRAYADRYSLEYRIGADVSAAIFRTYRVFALPTQFFIDPDGVVRAVVNGPLDLEAASDLIESILPAGSAASPGPSGSGAP